jgi:2-methylcitrate dehydratase
VDYPIGHRKRRAEGMPVLMRKFESSVRAQFEDSRARAIIELCFDRARLERMPVDEFLGRLAM